MKTKKQLYEFIDDIEYPSVSRFDYQTGEVIQGVDKRERVYLFYWPDGNTCFPVQMFLSHISDFKKINKLDGGTVGTYATNLSHIVRFCFNKKIQFHELRSVHIDDFIAQLVIEKKSNGERARVNNTIKNQILTQTITFLKWLQSEHYPLLNLIGVNDRKVRYQIALKKKTKRRGGRNFGTAEVYPTSLPNSVTKGKTPIPTETIKKLWDTLNATRDGMKLNSRFEALFDEEDKKAHLDYMYYRRRFQLTMLEATGLRPSELTEMRYSENIALIEQGKVILPTHKREDGRTHIIKLESGTLIKVQLFMKVYRLKLIERLLKYKLISDESQVDDYLFLNPDNGKKVQPRAAYQDFKRLCQRAGLKVKTCQSMFRHRFLTNMLKLYLVSFTEKNPHKNRWNINEKDYRSIYKKVAAFTDHKDPDSIEDYLDIAWDELEVFKYAYDVSELQNRLRSIHIAISDIKSHLNDKIEQSEELMSLLTEIEMASDLTMKNQC